LATKAWLRSVNNRSELDSNNYNNLNNSNRLRGIALPGLLLKAT